MPSLVVVGHLKATSKAARAQILDQFHQIVQYSTSEEPGVLRYAITVPRDAADETSIYAIEEYSTQQVSDDHIASKPVQRLVSMFSAQPAVLAETPKVYQMEYAADDSHFTRPGVRNAEQAFIVFATAKASSEPALSELVAAWKQVVAKAEADEPSTLMYALVLDKEDSKQIGTIEAYNAEADFEDHCKSAQVEQLVVKNRDIGGEMSYVTLKLHTGWLSK